MERRIIFRLTESMFKQIKEAIKNGRGQNASDLVRVALKEFFQKKDAAK
jgi:Arc/MetJ-type ribon-helix-helix transcriptional regulator